MVPGGRACFRIRHFCEWGNGGFYCGLSDGGLDDDTVELACSVSPHGQCGNRVGCCLAASLSPARTPPLDYGSGAPACQEREAPGYSAIRFALDLAAQNADLLGCGSRAVYQRSEERRVGKEGR